LRFLGFPDGGFHKPAIGIMAFTPARSEARSEMLLVSNPLQVLPKLKVSDIVAMVLEKTPDAVRSELRKLGQEGLGLVSSEFETRRSEFRTTIEEMPDPAVYINGEEFRKDAGRFFGSFRDAGGLVKRVRSAIMLPSAFAAEEGKLVQYDGVKLHALVRELTVANAGLLPAIFRIPISFLTTHSREAEDILDIISPLELRQLAVLYDGGELGQAYRALTTWFTPLNYHGKDPNKLASKVVSTDGQELWFWISTKDLKLHGLGLGCNSNLDAPEFMDPAAKEVVKLLVQHMIYKYLSLSRSEQREVALTPALLKHYLDMSVLPFIDVDGDNLRISVPKFVAEFQARESIEEAA